MRLKFLAVCTVAFRSLFGADHGMCRFLDFDEAVSGGDTREGDTASPATVSFQNDATTKVVPGGCDEARTEVPQLKAPRLDPADAANIGPTHDVVQASADLAGAVESHNSATSPVVPQVSESLNPLLNPLRAVPVAKPLPTSLLGGAASSISVLRDQRTSVAGSANPATVPDDANSCDETPVAPRQESQSVVVDPPTTKEVVAPPLWAQIIGDDDNEDDELSLSDDEDY